MLRLRRILAVLSVGLCTTLAAALPGCGDECADLGQTVCEKACACGGCSVKTQTGTPMTFASQAECDDFYATACADSPDDHDRSGCSDALESAGCEGGAMILPDACK